ncbi:MAG: TIGR01777 family oxidoreductase [Coxiellaceae bacterium]|nr:TIGR01777 family oxidoreductase [Coxiellaceae bacterium]
MDILIAGGSGFIGTTLTKFLIEDGHKVTILTRSPKTLSKSINTLLWDGKSLETDQQFNTIINLCGQNIASKRWSQKRKSELQASRIEPTKAIVSYIKSTPSSLKPRLLNASAIGYYPSSDQTQTEENFVNSKEQSFSRELVSEWESCAQKATQYGSEVSCLRTGVVLGKDGGMLAKILPAFKCGLGSVMGNKSDHLSWIHVDDLCRAIQFIIQITDPEPSYNLTSPVSCTQLSFAKTVAKACHKPCFLHLSAFFIQKIFGQMGKELLLANQKIYPKNLENAGFTFNYKEIEQAMSNILRR